MTNWQKTDWRNKPRIQMPTYTDEAALNAVESRLSGYPPLVFAGEARRLKAHLATAGRGEAFCCKAVIAPRALLNFQLTASATHSK